ncbi:MAG: DNA-binding response regulator [Desulfobacteraceae bacterium 4572_35.2]|nr:MAG: DNA-binding response regulator [Desulfobacteraceae bacterium 4572_35.2]
MNHLLLIDDDTELCELLRDYLEGERFTLTLVHDGQQGANIAMEPFDLVILDVMLPGLNGLDVLKQIRQHSNIPVIMLTARGDDVDRIVGLELGADDYLAKPFNPRELVARIRAIQRRSETSTGQLANNQITLGDLTLSPGARQCTLQNTALKLTSVEFSLIETLLLKAGQVISREDLVLQVLGRDLSPYDRSIDVHISSLRKKLGPFQDGSERIKTIRGIGYLYALANITEPEHA